MAERNDYVEKCVVQSTDGGDSESLTQREISRIGQRIPDKWEMIAMSTGKFEKSEVDNIRRNANFYDNVQKANQMLSDYKSKLGSRKDLASALIEHGKHDVAKLLQDTKDSEKKGVQEIGTKIKESLNITETDGPSFHGATSNGEPEIVFISYQWDIQEDVLKLKEALESENLTCWMDVKSTKGGDVLAEEIEKGIRGCKVFVACVTKNYSESDPCAEEVALAAKLKKKIVPLLLEGTWPVGGEMSVHFARLKYVKCKEGLTDEKLRKVVEDVKANTQ